MRIKQSETARLQAGLKGALTARIWIVTSICAFQYWLLTSSMEAYHAGNTRVIIPAIVATFVSLILNIGLLVSGEKLLPEIRSERPNESSKGSP